MASLAGYIRCKLGVGLWCEQQAVCVRVWAPFTACGCPLGSSVTVRL
jgi:hypothetical protein